jgi:signal peptidase II
MKKYSVPILLGIDQLTKSLVFLLSPTILLENGLGINCVKSKGFLWGLFASASYSRLTCTILVLIDIFIVVSFFRFYMEEYRKSSLISGAFSLIMAGLLGNLFDGIIFGFGRDFIAMPVLISTNFADIFIGIGLILLIVELIRGRAFKLIWSKSILLTDELRRAATFTHITRSDIKQTKDDFKKIWILLNKDIRFNNVPKT